MVNVPFTRVLLVQENPEYALFVKNRLAQEIQTAYQVKTADTLQGALEQLLASDIDIILVELSLPDAQGIEIFEKIQSQSPAVPVVILATLSDEMSALRAVQKGAQDYVLKIEDEGRLLPRVIRCAIERHRVKTELINMSFADDLTGLYNRRGFSMLAEQQLKCARRSKKGFYLFLMDLDGFKQINDTFGHAQGDIALRHTSALLRKTFRQSDVIARIGGDEFAVLAIESNADSAAIIQQRLETIFDEGVAGKLPAYKLSLSSGAAYFDPAQPVSFEQLFEVADGFLYQQKRSRSRH